MARLIHLKRDDPDAAGTPIGYRCTETGGSQLGTISGALAEPDSRTIPYLLLATDGGSSSREYVIPADRIVRVNDANRTLTLEGITRSDLDAGRIAAFSNAWLDAGANGSEPGQWRLELLEERLKPEVEQIPVGSVRLSRRVVEREETVNVPVREEFLVIERTDGQGVVRVGDRDLGPNESLELPILQERVVVTKEPVIYQAVTVRKQLNQRTEEARATLRREELDVEDPHGLVAPPDGAVPQRE